MAAAYFSDGTDDVELVAKRWLRRRESGGHGPGGLLHGARALRRPTPSLIKGDVAVLKDEELERAFNVLDIAFHAFGGHDPGKDQWRPGA